MAGTKIGGAKTKQTIYSKYGADYYARIGKLGGHNGHETGFRLNRELAREAGRRGGIKSRRGPVSPERKRQLARQKAHAEFQEGLNKPGWGDKLRTKFKELR